MEASIRELRQDTKAILAAVEAGEEVTITRRGEPIARLEPIAPRPPEYKMEQDLPGFGMWADHPDMQDPAAYLRQLRQPRYRLDEDPLQGES